MKFLLPTVAALVAAPTVVNAWTFGLTPYGRSLVETTPSQMLKRQNELMNRFFDEPFFTDPYAQYEITQDDEKFEVAIDVPGVKAEDVNVSLENDGKVLSISGHREDRSENYVGSTKFSQRFSLDPTIDVEKFSANLKNGVLVVSAPRDLKRIEESTRKIPVMKAAEEETAKTAAAETEQEIPVNKK